MAGYSGNDAMLRSAGYKAARMDKVIAFLKWAEADGAGTPDIPCTGEELKKILSRHARGADKPNAIRASEVLIKLEQAEEDEDEHNPEKTLDQIAVLDPLMAAAMAKLHNIPWTPSEELRAKIDAARREIAMDYFRELKTKEANGHSANGAAANQQAVVNPINGQAQPVASIYDAPETPTDKKRTPWATTQ
jgi:hypothetical protein